MKSGHKEIYFFQWNLNISCFHFRSTCYLVSKHLHDHIIHVKLELISFPDPTCKIRVEDDKHSGFIAKNCKLWTTVLAFKQIDKYVDVPGYILSFDIESIDSSFNESPELRIFVSNKEGTRKYEIRSNNSKKLNPFGTVLVIAFYKIYQIFLI